MIKAVFASEFPKDGIKLLKEIGTNALFINSSKLKKLPLRELAKNRIKTFIEISLFVGEDLWKKYPGSRPVDREGSLMKKIDWYAGVCPNHPEIRKEKLQLIKEVIEKYPVDGIWLDFIRYPCHWEQVRNSKITEYCFCQNCLRGFRKEVKTPPRWPEVDAKDTSDGGRVERSGASDSSEVESWIRWKCNQITDFVKETDALINQSGKNIKLGMFSIPWKEKEFGGAIKKIIGQDFKSLAKYIDVFSPMVYHRICERELDWISQMVKYMAKTTKKEILPIIQVADFPIRQASQPPSSGFILFTLDRLLPKVRIGFNLRG